jgi:hypothetical protein
MFRNWKNWALMFASVLFFASFARALQLSSDSREQQRTYPLAGIVVNAATGRPVSRALVQLPPWNGRVMLTDAQGGFSFDHVPEGLVQILVSKPGFVYHGTNTIPSTPTSIQLGPETGKLVLKLTETAVIFGQVENQDEEPIEGASLAVVGMMILEGRHQLKTVYSAIRSDANGNFRITGLAPGRYYLAVRPGGMWLNNFRSQTIAARSEDYLKILYYPSSPNLEGASPLDLTAGQHAELNFKLEPVPRRKVSGMLVNLASWSRVDPPAFVDEMGEVLIEPEAFSPPSGAFAFRGVPTGSYLVRLGATDEKGHHSVWLRRINVEANITDLRLPLTPGVDIPVVVNAHLAPNGTVTCLSSDGAPNASGCTRFYPAARVELHSLDFTSTVLYSQVSKEKDPPLDVPGVVPGSYVVVAKPVFGGYIQSVLCGKLDLLHEPLVVSESGRVPPIEVVVRDDASTVTVQVHRETPDQKVLVLVFSQPLGVAGPEWAVTGHKDDYQSDPLAPGTYKVLAFDASDTIDYSDPRVLDKYASHAVTIEVAARQSASVAVDVIRAGD